MSVRENSLTVRAVNNPVAGSIAVEADVSGHISSQGAVTGPVTRLFAPVADVSAECIGELSCRLNCAVEEVPTGVDT